MVAQDPAIEARDGDVDARRAEVGDQDVPGSAQKASWRGGRPPVLGAEIAFHHEPAIDELLDPSRDDRPAEAGAGDQLGARARPAEPDLVEDRDERVEHLVRQGNVRSRA